MKSCADCYKKISEKFTYCEECGFIRNKVNGKISNLRKRMKTINENRKKQNLNEFNYIIEEFWLRIMYDDLERNGNTIKCLYCRELRSKSGYNDMQLEHIIPITKGGNTTKENLTFCCSICNRFKSNRNEKELKWIISKMSLEMNKAHEANR